MEMRICQLGSTRHCVSDGVDESDPAISASTRRTGARTSKCQVSHPDFRSLGPRNPILSRAAPEAHLLLAPAVHFSVHRASRLGSSLCSLMRNRFWLSSGSIQARGGSEVNLNLLLCFSALQKKQNGPPPCRARAKLRRQYFYFLRVSEHRNICQQSVQFFFSGRIGQKWLQSNAFHVNHTCAGNRLSPSQARYPS